MRITAFGVGPRAVRLAYAENAFRGNRLDCMLDQEMARQAAAEISPMADNHASAAYRRQLVEVLVERSIKEAVARAALR